ncbi:MAG TPA: cupin domain-containing protein [Myxococcota bacterium]|jgi:mannose-6-phosphate isomerase-like protein (cupin superfamily)|nr:cupin domain-containing protein [Myxococcota bacterium]
MATELQGGTVFTVADADATEYLPNRGVWLAGLLGKDRGDGIGLYHGRIEPGCAIAREVHPGTSETVWVLSGEAVGLCGDKEVPLRPGQVLHVQKNVPHGLRNAGKTPLEFIVIGHPDF